MERNCNWNWKCEWLITLLNEPNTAETKILGILNKLKPNNKVILNGKILDIACNQNRVKIVNKLFELGMNPNIELGPLPVFFSTHVLKNNDLFKIFIRNGVKLESKKHSCALKAYVRVSLITNRVNFKVCRKIFKFSNFRFSGVISPMDLYQHSDCALQYLVSSNVDKDCFLSLNNLIELEEKTLILRESKEVDNILDLNKFEQKTTTMTRLMRVYLKLSLNNKKENENTKYRKNSIIFLIAKIKQKALLTLH